MITGPQCRAARALVEYTRNRLAISAAIAPEIIENFERMLNKPTLSEIAKLKETLEQAGAVFIEENGGGVGVRLKFNRSESKRISMLEGEGGIVANNDVP